MRVRLGIPRSKNQWVLTLMGAAVTVGCAVPLAQGVLSLSWPNVDGVITHSRDMAGYRAIGVDIGYRYATGGQTYTGARFRFQFVLTARHMWSRDVRSILGRYRVGEPVKIAVNPGNPADSVLEPGPDLESMIPFVLGLFLLLLGLGDVRKDEPVHGIPRWSLPPRPRYGLSKLLALTGGAIFFWGAFYLYQGINSIQWPSVEGRILYSHARGDLARRRCSGMNTTSTTGDTWRLITATAVISRRFWKSLTLQRNDIPLDAPFRCITAPDIHKMPSSSPVYGGATLSRLRWRCCSSARLGWQRDMPI